MIIRVFEDDTKRANKLVQILTELISKHASIFTKVVKEDKDWYEIVTNKEKNLTSEEYWFIDIKYESQITSTFKNEMLGVLSECNYWEEDITAILNNDNYKNFYGLILIPVAINYNINFSFCSNNYDILKDYFNTILQKVEDHQKIHKIDKADFLTEDNTEYHLAVLNYILSLYSSNYIMEMNESEWRFFRGDGEKLAGKLKNHSMEKISQYVKNGYPFRMHHVNPYHEWENREDLRDKELLPHIFREIPKDKKVWEAINKIPYYKRVNHYTWNMENNWRTPPLKSIFLDEIDTSNKSDYDFEKIIKLSLEDFDNRVLIKSINNKIFNKSTNLKQKERNFTLQIEAINTAHMLHLWFNLPGILGCLLYDFGFGKNPLKGINWLRNGYKETELVFTLVGGERDGNFYLISGECQNSLVDGFTVMIFMKEPQKYYSEYFGINGQDSHKLCMKLFNYGAGWVLYTNEKENNPHKYFSTIVLPKDGNEITKEELEIKWNLKDKRPPLIAFHIMAKPSSSIYGDTVVPLVGNSIQLSNANIEKHILNLLREYLKNV